MKDKNSEIRILIVEDDAIVAMHLKILIKRMGFNVLGPVSSGEEAVEMALELNPTVVLMDIKLKGRINGIEAAEQINKKAEIPVIYLTAYADDEIIEKCKTTNPYGFLSKPVREKELLAGIETAIYKSSTDKTLQHLYQLLSAIRNIDKLIANERNAEKLLTEACRILVKSKEYSAVHIISKNTLENIPSSISEKKQKLKFKNDFSGKKIEEFYKELLFKYNDEKISLLNYDKDSFVFDRLYEAENIDRFSAAICPMIYSDENFGFLIVTNYLDDFDSEETELLQTLAEDLAFALHSINLEVERVKAVQSLQEKESYFRSLLHNMHEDILVIDENFNIIDANNSILKSTSHTSTDIIGKKCFEISHNFTSPCSENDEDCELKKTFETGKPQFCHHIHKKTDGSLVHVDILFSPLKEKSGKVTKVIESIRDVSSIISTREALSQSEERVKQIAENIDVVLFTIQSKNGNDEITYLSPAFEKIWGIERNKILQDKNLLFESIHKEDRNKLISFFERAKSIEGFNEKIECRIVKPDKSERWISFGIRSIKNSFNVTKDLIGIAEDITERNLTRVKLERSEQDHKNLFENAHDPIVIFKIDTGKILNTNRKAEKVFGYTKNELIGKSYFELCLNPDLLLEKIKDLDTVETVSSFEMDSIKKDKSLIIFEMNLSLTEYHGQKACISNNRDISFRKQAEKELRVLSEIVKQSPDSVILTNVEGKIEYVNTRFSESTGYSYDEVIGKVPRLLQKGENSGIESKEMWNALQHGYAWKGEFINLKKDKEPYWASVIISPIKNETGAISHFLLLEEDVTHKKELEIELKLALTKSNEINEFKTHLLGNLNHEIRTPMNSIIGFAQIMSEETKDQSVLEMSGKIIKSSYRLLNTLNSIIELSDLESERIKVNRSEVDLPDLVKYLDYSYKKAFEEKNLKLEIEIKKDKLVVSSDEKLLEQVMKHLLDNALKYTEKGKIKIELDELVDESAKTYAVLSVSDTGVGIPNQNREFIFDAFRQSSEGVKRRYEGTGLGLTIAQKMMKLLNGRIEVDSKEGVGSKFSVYLPLPKNYISSEKQNQVSGYQAAKRVNGELPNLLIVEDYLMNIDIMKYFLNDLANINHATCFDETIDLVRQKEFDIILMDIILKDSESGLELMKAIREIEHYKHIPIIAITGYTSTEDQEVFINEGFNGFLAKPFDKNQLRDIIIQNVYVH